MLGLYWECKRSAEPIAWSEIESWLRLTGRELEPCELRLLVELDNAYVQASSAPVSEAESNAAKKHEVKARLRSALRAASK